MMMAKKKLFPMLLALMVLLAGCGGPSAAEGAEPSSAPNATVSDATAPAQDTQSHEAPQETEPAPAPEVNTWKSLKLVNADTIIAENTDGTYAILDSNGSIQKTLPECNSVALINQYCFWGRVDNTYNLYDLNGSVVLTSQNTFERTRLNTGENPWGVIRYEVIEKADFGGKTITHFMRTDTFEDIYQADGDMSHFAGTFGYDGTQYLLKTLHTDTRSFTYSTLDGTELPDYQEPDPLAAMSEYETFLMSLGYRKRELVDSGIGGLGRKEDGSTDIYNVNRELCASYDNQVQLATTESLGNLGVLTTNTAAGFQAGVFDFQAGEFLFIVDGSVQTKVIHDAYTLDVSSFLLENAEELHTLVCKNGTMIENVSMSSLLYNSAAGYVLLTSTVEADKIVIINVDTGEIVSEFQAHLRNL